MLGLFARMVYDLIYGIHHRQDDQGQTYYYLREVARVGGKPKIVSQRYLGKASDIEAAVAGATVVPDRTRHLAFGDVAAVWEMLGRLKVAEIIDDVEGRAGPTPGRRLGPTSPWPPSTGPRPLFQARLRGLVGEDGG